ncbi:efflux RND transporter periplasmic adaptor subunit [Usitatibacter palustris]|uniref:Multidrug resistance protein MdtA n=1 Tax=Usitatibacter palustris TaxID=2732487 RepID=A0A6M4H848_9PROT|nr:efflux RND transporter periplasmic adaptor subunit [Usitatibacter palustris]QJR15859.1 Multidrug resistance protein MdtA [Usitatibacter palustris]
MTATSKRRVWIATFVVVLVAAGLGTWYWLGSKSSEAQGARKGPAPIPVVTAKVESRDVPVKLRANGNVVALQSVEIRPQVTSTVRAIHFTEGQSVKAGELLFSLDARADEANMRKAQAQVEKDKADLLTATRDFERQKELFNQKFISQAALDVAQNKVDTLRGQIAVDQAAADSARVAVGYSEIRATFAGRTGVVSVRPGSLVQPSSPPLVTVTQVNPIQVSFTLPEKELAGLRGAMVAGAIEVSVLLEGGGAPLKGKLTFLDNAVDTTTGTIRVKAEFSNDQGRLWPGMYVNVELAPRTIVGGSVVPVQAVQTGPDNRFIYVVGEDRKVTQKTVTLALVDGSIAVIEGVSPGQRIVVEGTQNLRTGTSVVEADRAGAPAKSGGKGKAP